MGRAQHNLCKELNMEKKLYCGNLSYGMTDESLKEAFAAFGTVESAVVIKDKFSGRSKGFGFVEMSTEDEAKAAIEGMNGKEVDGRKIVVNESRPQEERPRRDFGGDRGGFGGGNKRW